MKRALNLALLFFSLTILLTSCADQGGEFVITYNDQKSVKETMEELRGEGFKLVKKCMCGNKLKMHLWQSPPGLGIDETVQKAKDKVGVDGVEMNFALDINLPQPLPVFEVQDAPKDDNENNNPPTQQRRIKVAIIDTGLETYHNDLVPYQWFNQNEVTNNSDDDNNCLIDDRIGYDFLNDRSWPMDDFGHGTHIAGIVAKDFPKEIDLRIIDLKMHDGKEGDLFGAVCAMYYGITKKARVMNLSWGYFGDKSEILEKAVSVAEKEDILLVASAGNDTIDIDNNLYWPACFGYNNLITVAAWDDANNKLAEFSNFGFKHVDLAASGVDINSTFPNDTHIMISGSSMSAGYVTQAAAIIRAIDPSLSAATTRDAIMKHVKKVSSLNGVVNAEGILDLNEVIIAVGGPI
ncbi:MAG: S8 family serine peptidase [Bacteroidota bacterium]